MWSVNERKLSLVMSSLIIATSVLLQICLCLSSWFWLILHVKMLRLCHTKWPVTLFWVKVTVWGLQLYQRYFNVRFQVTRNANICLTLSVCLVVRWPSNWKTSNLTCLLIFFNWISGLSRASVYQYAVESFLWSTVGTFETWFLRAN